MTSTDLKRTKVAARCGFVIALFLLGVGLIAVMPLLGLFGITVIAMIGAVIVYFGHGLFSRRGIEHYSGAKITIGTAVYCLVMLVMSSAYNSTLMDPMQLLWIFCLIVLGPVIFVSSLVSIIRGRLHPMPLFAICAVVVWSFGFWRIGALLRPCLYPLVSGHNERLAVAFMKEHAPDERLVMGGFRYPFLSLGNTYVTHKEGAVFIMIPDAPGPKDHLIYVTPGAKPPEYSRPFSGSWYYEDARGET